MPVFLFALSQADRVALFDTILMFLVLHLLVFPATNGYNSYMDRDEGSIGGLKNPPPVSSNLFKATLLMDILAVGLSVIISLEVALLILGFILMSRAYSYRRIRLKKHPYLAFLIVFIFQGGYIYLISEMAVSSYDLVAAFDSSTIICMLISSFFIGSMYPLTQIYQHEADKNDGVTSISYLLGYRGTFIFSGLMFLLAALLLVYYFMEMHFLAPIFLFAMLFLPVIMYMGNWFLQVSRSSYHANYSNTMLMNNLASGMMNLYFVLLIVINLIR